MQAVKECSKPRSAVENTEIAYFATPISIRRRELARSNATADRSRTLAWSIEPRSTLTRK